MHPLVGLYPYMHALMMASTGPIKEVKDMRLPESNERYCEDNCPIFYAIDKYNDSHKYKIRCSTDFCSHVMEVNIKNKGDKTNGPYDH